MVVNILLFYGHTLMMLSVELRMKLQFLFLLLPIYVFPLGPSGCPASLPASLEAAAFDCSSPSDSLLLWRAALSDS